MPRLLTPVPNMAVGASFLMCKERLQRDLDRLARFRHLTSDFGESLSGGGKERAKDMEATLVESLLESSAAFVRATAAVRRLIGET
jgi:hypothetical protein